MRSGRRTLALLACLLAAICAMAPAAVAAPDPAIVDCTTHNHLTRQYSAAELRHAIATLSADVKEYTSCPDILQRALDARLGNLHVGGGGGGGGSFLPTPVLVLLILLVLAGAAFGGLALRRRAAEGAAEDPGEQPAAAQREIRREPLPGRPPAAEGGEAPPTAKTRIRPPDAGEQPTEALEREDPDEPA